MKKIKRLFWKSHVNSKYEYWPYLVVTYICLNVKPLKSACSLVLKYMTKNWMHYDKNQPHEDVGDMCAAADWAYMYSRKVQYFSFKINWGTNFLKWFCIKIP